MNSIVLHLLQFVIQSPDSNEDGGVGGDVLPFEVDQHTGVVSTRRRLDRETDGSHFRFHVTTGDFSASEFVVGDRATVVVHVINLNDNSPRILFPVCEDAERRDCELDVANWPLPGDVITRVVAVDPDDDSGQLRYELVGGGGDAELLFVVNSTSGEVFARRDFDEEHLVNDDGGRIPLQVRVIDAGTPPLTASVEFVVRLNVTRRHRLLGVDGPPTSTNLALPLVLVAACAVVIVVVCFLAVRRIGPLDRTYSSAAAAYVSETSVDDVTCAADCSTDVALGSSLRHQVASHVFTPPFDSAVFRTSHAAAASGGAGGRAQKLKVV